MNLGAKNLEFLVSLEETYLLISYNLEDDYVTFKDAMDSSEPMH